MAAGRGRGASTKKAKVTATISRTGMVAETAVSKHKGASKDVRKGKGEGGERYRSLLL